MRTPSSDAAVGTLSRTEARTTPADRIGRRWTAGDERAVREAYETWGGAIHAYCVRRLGPVEGADATQDVFVSAWRSRDRFDPSRGNLPQWLFGIARNVVAGTARAGSRRPVPVEDLGDDRTDVDTGAGGTDAVVADRLLAAAALALLPVRQRDVLRASFFGGMTNVEVAAHLDIPLGTVKSDIRRGLGSLRDELRRRW